MPRAPGFASMLKEGAKHVEGVDDVIHRNIDACVELSKMSSSSYGPCGLTKFVINHLNKLYSTSDAAVIMNELDVVHPAAKLLSEASGQQDNEVGDGTNYVIVFGSALLSRASTNLLRLGLTPSQILRGYNIAMQKSLAILESIADKHRLNELTDVNEVAEHLRPVIASKSMGYEDFFAPLIADACIKTIKNSGLDKECFNVDNVRICKIRGGSTLSSFLVQGLVLKSDVEGQCRFVEAGKEPVKMAVFSCPFDISTLETKGTVLLHNANELLSFTKSEESSLNLQIKALHDAGVQVVVSGSKFSDLAVHYLNQFNMLAIKVTSKFELRRIARSCGAFVHPKVIVPASHDLGLCRKIYCEEIGQTQVIRIDSFDSKVMTLVVRASTDQILDDIERAMHDSINVYKVFTRDNRLIPGACATDIELAHQLSAFSTDSLSNSKQPDNVQVDNDNEVQKQEGIMLPTDGLERYAIQAFGEAFELPVRLLIDNCGLNGTEMLAKLYSKHAGLDSTEVKQNMEESNWANRANIGIVLPSGEFIDVCSPPINGHKIMDSYLVKMWSIKLAFQAVSAILSVDQIIMSRPAGGPKPKDNPNWDQD